MKKTILFLSLLLAACTPYWENPDRSIVTPAIHLSPATSPVSTIGWQEYVVIGTVNIRANPNVESPVIGILYAGAKVKADCDRADEFCEVISGYIISACLGVGEGVCK